MLLPTAIFIARQLPGPLNDVADAGNDIATTAIDAGGTATDAGKTVIDVGEDIQNQAENGVNLYSKYMGLAGSLQKLAALCGQNPQLALILAIAIIVIICFLWVYCCAHCVLDCRSCCCKSRERAREEHLREAHFPPPSPTTFCCGNLHWDRTYIARACGHIPVQAGEAWGFWGRKGNWFYQLREGVYRWPDWCPAAIKTEAGRREQKERFERWARQVAAGAETEGKKAYSLAELRAKKGLRFGREETNRGRSRIREYRHDSKGSTREGGRKSEGYE